MQEAAVTNFKSCCMLPANMIKFEAFAIDIITMNWWTRNQFLWLLLCLWRLHTILNAKVLYTIAIPLFMWMPCMFVMGCWHSKSTIQYVSMANQNLQSPEGKTQTRDRSHEHVWKKLSSSSWWLTRSNHPFFPTHFYTHTQDWSQITCHRLLWKGSEGLNRTWLLQRLL